MTADSLQRDNLAGVIVLYNPDSSTIDNIKTYVNYLAHLYVVDNSEAHNAELIDTMLSISNKITYHPFGENIGIATALNKGCQFAAGHGYKWILTMDQDSYFANGDFFSGVFDRVYTDTAVIAASYNNIHFRPGVSAYPALLEVDYVITSGNILNIAAWQILGGFTDKLFIDEVDNEFCIRAKNKGFKILVSESIYLKHKLGDGFKAKHVLTRKELTLTKHSPLRVYYTVRNNLYMWRKFAFSNCSFVANRVKNIIYLVFKILLYFPEKRVYFSYIGKAINDSFRGKYGKFSK